MPKRAIDLINLQLRQKAEFMKFFWEKFDEGCYSDYVTLMIALFKEHEGPVGDRTQSAWLEELLGRTWTFQYRFYKKAEKMIMGYEFVKHILDSNDALNNSAVQATSKSEGGQADNSDKC